MSTVAFLASVGGVSLVTRRIRADERWPSYRYELAVTVVILLVTFVVFMASVAGEWAVVGLTQRLFVGAISLWIVLRCLRLSRLAATNDPGETAPGRSASPGRETVMWPPFTVAVPLLERTPEGAFHHRDSRRKPTASAVGGSRPGLV